MFSSTRLPRTVQLASTFLLFSLLQSQWVMAQAGLRKSLERLDRDNDGELHPREITALARPNLERITCASRMSIDSQNEMEDLLHAARRYCGTKNAVSDRTRSF
ncbi:hypothetical protein OAL43_02280 [bacterium]|nr:hypothetical protein [bacterium]